MKPSSSRAAISRKERFIGAKSIVGHARVTSCNFFGALCCNWGSIFHKMLSKKTAITVKISLLSLTKFPHSLILVVATVHVLLTNSWCLYYICCGKMVIWDLSWS